MTISATVAGYVHNRLDGEDRHVSFVVSTNEDSIGFRRCGVSPGIVEDSGVDRVNILAALLMDEMHARVLVAEGLDAKRCMATAMTNIETAQMFAARALSM